MFKYMTLDEETEYTIVYWLGAEPDDFHLMTT
jgi:hypothetical protein